MPPYKRKDETCSFLLPFQMVVSVGLRLNPCSVNGLLSLQLLCFVKAFFNLFCIGWCENHKFVWHTSMDLWICHSNHYQHNPASAEGMQHILPLLDSIINLHFVQQKGVYPKNHPKTQSPAKEATPSIDFTMHHSGSHFSRNNGSTLTQRPAFKTL